MWYRAKHCTVSELIVILTQGMDATTPQDTEPAVETLCRGASNQVLKVFSFVELIVPSTW